VSFTVPTGNFGDIFAGYAAKRMGLPVDKLVIATNANDILARTLETGRYEMTGVHATSSPSMDIQISSNFERLLFESCGRDADTVRRLMQQLGQSGSFTLPGDMLAAIRAEFVADRTDEAGTAVTIREVLGTTAYLLDPHTAVGVRVAEALDADGPMITLGTAHPAKFPASVKAACGREPALPPVHADLMGRTECFDRIPADLDAVETYIRERSRAVRKGAAA
jgi:threonine synthase